MSTVTLRRHTGRTLTLVTRLPMLMAASSSGLVLLVLLWGGWSLTSRPVQMVVDGVPETVYTHRRSVDALLLDLGLTLQANDQVAPPLTTAIHSQLAITIARARPIQIWADGRQWETSSWGQTADAILTEAGVTVDQYDQVQVGDRTYGMAEPLPPLTRTPLPQTYSRGYAWDDWLVEPLQLRLQRAIPLVVKDGGLPFTVRTTAQTVGEALRQAEITIYLGDGVQPSLGTQLSPGLRVQIQRSKPIVLRVDNRVMKTRSRAQTVGDALVEVGVGISGLDQVSPPLDTLLKEDLAISITRVRETVEVTEQIAPFETVFQPDANLAIDLQQERTPGAEGITRQRYRVRYENGQEVSRALEDTWTAQEPAQRVIVYGQRIEPQTATMPDGQQITYWRKVRMFASSYSAATAGVSPSESWYGRTYTGEPMRKGVVAVDPRIIPLRAKVFVTGYGYGDALDVGSAIRSRRIDLGYDNDNLVLWNRWVDVYLLWPPPPAHQITWVIPNYPRVPN
ncbi:MAG: DUF348 domain-containing protein [Caldilineaceae bacterium]|nr:DUF348 domain-containing protein [Caldilineaceae bacterium]